MRRADTGGPYVYSLRGNPRAQRLVGVATFASAILFFGRGAEAQLAGGGTTDPIIPFNDTSVRGSVSSFIDGPSATTVRPWTFSGDVDVEAGLTDSPGGIQSSGVQPVILIAPDFSLNGTTSRLNVALTYSPRLAIYPSTSSQTIISQSFNGSADAVLVPNLLFLSVRGISDVGSRFGDTSLQSNSFVSRSEAVQTTSFSFSPYLQRTIAGYGTVTVGYMYAQTFQDSDNRYNSLFLAPGAANTAGFGTTGNLQTNTEFGSFTTGENLGRVQESISASASQLSGSYFYQGASTLSVTDRLSYAVYRWLTVFVTGGYQEYNYPRSSYLLDEPTYSVGVTLTPNETSSITLQYGQIAGTNTILANGTFSPTPRTRVFGSYTVDIETGLGARQSLLNGTTVGVGGALISNLTGAPTLANTYLASQSPLSRVKTATIGGAILLDRDAVTLTAGRSEFEQLGNSTSVLGVSTPSGTNTTSNYVSLSWQHELNPSTSLFSGVSYATSENGVFYGVPGGSSDTVQLYSSLNHVFTDTLSGHITVNHSERTGSAIGNLPAAYGGNASQNTILVGLRKSF